MSESKTPRTDDHSWYTNNDQHVVDADLARQLETELTEAKAEIERLKSNATPVGSGMSWLMNKDGRAVTSGSEKSPVLDTEEAVDGVTSKERDSSSPSVVSYPIEELAEAKAEIERLKESLYGYMNHCAELRHLTSHSSVMIDEIDRLRRGEYICQKCGLRKDGEAYTNVEF